jgi:GT2 family glycosyltransferase
VSIVIPTLGGDMIARCLESLRTNVGEGIAYEVVVVANGPSAAGLVGAADFSSGVVRLVTAPVNLGFGGGCNRGAAETSVSSWFC